MIRYALKCAKAHEFESWFQSAGAYDALRGAGHVACPLCGDTAVEKLLMAPSVRPARKAEGAKPSLQTPASEMEAALAAMRAEIEKNSDYVGMNFVAEARKMHAGEAPERAIHGEARLEEAKKLIEEGIPVAPLPFLPKRQAN
jgi:hypothetical protein